jgi:hypothetical protein
MQTFLGSSRGKFKYNIGLSARLEGFLFNQVFYCIEAGYSPFSSVSDVGDRDSINPSQIVNVKSDYVRYLQTNSVRLDQAFLQKSFNLGYGCYSRVACGHFDVAYGGIGGEFLYYPVDSSWAIGAEAATIKKRRYSGFEFTKQVRKLVGTTATYEDFTGRQYFLDLYYDLPQIGMDLKLRAGKFLAKDNGVRFEVARNFSSGLKISFWYTVTNGKDHVNGETYFDKGVAFTMPMDIFYKESFRGNWGYGMSAWLRDVGAYSPVGKSLFSTLKSERQ